jgi:hypothetical protein
MHAKQGLQRRAYSCVRGRESEIVFRAGMGAKSWVTPPSLLAVMLLYHHLYLVTPFVEIAYSPHSYNSHAQALMQEETVGDCSGPRTEWCVCAINLDLTRQDLHRSESDETCDVGEIR